MMKKPELVLFVVDGGSPSYILEGVKNGELPGFERLLKSGVSFSDCMPVFPSISPTCWASIATGAVPSVHGALCQTMHKDGTMPDEFITPYSGVHVHAERFWESAARVGKKSLMMNFLASGPVRCDGVFQVMGGTTITPDKDAGDTYMSGIPQQYFHIKNKNEIFVSGAKTPSGQWTAFDSVENLCEKNDDGVYVFPVMNTDPRYDENEVEAFTWTVITYDDGIRIGVDREDAEKQPLLKEKEWTDVISRNLKTNIGEAVFQFRARLDIFDKKDKSCQIYVTSAKNILKEVCPTEYAKEIQKIKEVPNTNAHGISIWGEAYDLEKFMCCEEFVFNWHKKVIKYTVDNYDCDIVVDGSGLIDTINHRFRSTFEKVAENYEKEYEVACKAYKDAYKLIDEHILWLYENVVDENTTVCVVSDHGSVGWHETANPCTVLEKAGLITYTTDDFEEKTWRNKNVDWSKSKAYPVGSSYINVNLKGREPTGIVEEKDYEKTVEEIIKSLHKYTVTKDGETGIAFAVEKNQAGFFGVGGKNCGDVVYGIRGSKLGGYYGQVHGNQIPSARTKTGDIRSFCAICGGKFKENEVLDRPIDLTDIAPTLCYALGYPQPDNATGGVVFKALKEEM